MTFQSRNTYAWQKRNEDPISLRRESGTFLCSITKHVLVLPWRWTTETMIVTTWTILSSTFLDKMQQDDNSELEMFQMQPALNITTKKHFVLQLLLRITWPCHAFKGSTREKHENLSHYIHYPLSWIIRLSRWCKLTFWMLNSTNTLKHSDYCM